jgi:hypothetical protein
VTAEPTEPLVLKSGRTVRHAVPSIWRRLHLRALMSAQRDFLVSANRGIAMRGRGLPKGLA